MGSLVEQTQSVYDSWKAGRDLTTISDADGAIRDKFLAALDDAALIESTFYAARDEEFAALETQYQADRAALATLWQARENATFDTTVTL